MKKGENKSQWEQNLEDELLYFINMCGEEDRKIFDKPKKKRTIEEYGRLICITTAIGVRGAMLWLYKRCEDNRIEPDGIFNYMDSVPFETAEKWVDEFVGGIEHPLLKQVAVEIWGEKRAKLTKEKFNIRDLL